MHFDWLKWIRPLSPRRQAHRIFRNSNSLESRFLPSAIAVGPVTSVDPSSAANQFESAIAIDDNGDFVVVWNGTSQDIDSFGIFAQRYNFAGEPQGNQLTIQASTIYVQFAPAVAMDADGDFVIGWQGSGTSDNAGIYARLYNSTGQDQGPPFLVNTHTSDFQITPSVSMDHAGNFVIAWASQNQDGSLFGVYAQRYSLDGQPLGSEFQVNTTTTQTQDHPAVAVNSAGDFVVSWESKFQDGDNFGICAQRYNQAGQAQGSEFQINSYFTGEQSFPSIALDDSGNFVIAWESDIQDGDGLGIFAQRYDASGQPQESEFRVNTFISGDQFNSSVAMDSDGDFVISWQSYGNTPEESGLFAQLFSAAGQARGTSFQIAPNFGDAQFGAGIAIDSDGDTLIKFNNFDSASSHYGVYWQRYRTSQIDNTGAWQSARFFLDSNNSGSWDSAVYDTLIAFGNPSDTPLVGDWNGDGYSGVGIWRAGKFYLDSNDNGVWDSGIDSCFSFGNPTDTPLVGDWNQDGRDEIGVWRSGKFYLDLNANGGWDLGIDSVFAFGNPTDTPLIGDWNADGTDDVAVKRDRKYYHDTNGNHFWDIKSDSQFGFGNPSDTPIVGDWNGDGTDDIGVWRNGQFYLDSNGDQLWNRSLDTVTFIYRDFNETPLVGYWRPTTAIPVPSIPPLTVSAPQANILSSLLQNPKKKTS